MTSDRSGTLDLATVLKLGIHVDRLAEDIASTVIGQLDVQLAAFPPEIKCIIVSAVVRHMEASL